MANHLPELRQEQINMLNLLDLRNDLLQAGHESFRVVIMENVQVNALITTSEEGFIVALRLDIAANGCQNKRSRINRLKVTSWHLQYD
jgi:hypothetical protein